MTDDSGTSTRYKLCKDIPKEKGQAYVLWEAELLDAAGGEGDEDASWAQTFLGTDRRAGLTPAETRRRTVRNRKAVAKLLEVIPDVSLKSAIRAEAVNRPAGGPGLATDATIAFRRGCVGK